MSFKQLETLHPVLARIDELQERVDEAKAAQPDAYDRIILSSRHFLSPQLAARWCPGT